MLQLNHNIDSNIAAILPYQTGSFTGSIDIVFTYDLTNQTSSATVPIISNNGYVLCDISGSQIPSNTGYYTLDFISQSLTLCQQRAQVSGSNETTINQYSTSSIIFIPYE